MASSGKIPPTMRAQQWTSVPTTLAQALRLTTDAVTPKPETLKAHQVLVKVHYAALNPVDYKLPELPIVGRLAISKPASPSADYSGTVVVAGSARPDLRPGQWVFGTLEPPEFGAMAEYIIVKSKEGCVALPDGVKPEEAAAVGIAGLTAYQCIIPKVTGSKANVFINGGSGGTGVFGIQIAKAKGYRVVTTCSSRNVDFCREMGADEVIDYTKQDILAELTKSAQTHGPFDLTVDNVGGATALFWKSHLYLSRTAQYVAVGATPGLQAIIDFAKLFLWPSFLGGGQRKYVFVGCETKAEQLKEIADWIAEGNVKVPIEEMYGLEEAPRAFERIHTGRVRGKLVVKVSE